MREEENSHLLKGNCENIDFLLLAEISNVECPNFCVVIGAELITISVLSVLRNLRFFKLWRQSNPMKEIHDVRK